VPQSILVAKDVKDLESKYVTYKSGSEAGEAFKTDPTIFTRFLAVNSTDHSIQYKITKVFLHSEQYAFFDFSVTLYLADLRDYIELLNETLLKQRVQALPFPFDSKKNDTIKKYRDFFKLIGSHVILGTTYGAEYQFVSSRPSASPSIRIYPLLGRSSSKYQQEDCRQFCKGCFRQRPGDHQRGKIRLNRPSGGTIQRVRLCEKIHHHRGGRRPYSTV
jgi:hypothetical protein